ncbi:His-Xaa-Ser system protein HxsD [Chitinophaga sp. 22321]|uniref:His-Xaa-Ser system protein HxsD n=1 Tax=Chitinophaga hostae TaxID=2831022 RepID=A0ABS5IX17_9BACT|nr:His-Xaa-Ser system protein HxsD [Chitinophaga hostae]MBS0027489.1 His-Xaa-Ser system protein HxsD [Chitinophaga hostae]
METHQNDDVLNVTIDAEIYPEVVLLKCLYWYTNNFEVEIGKLNNLQYKITLKALHQTETLDWDNIVLKLKQDLIDFKLRQFITNETQTIRELIIAKAFAYYDHEKDPISEISDPVGFSPQSIKV